MKWRLPPEFGKPQNAVKLAHPPTMGVQTGQSWTRIAIQTFCESSDASALAAKDALRVLIPQQLGLQGVRWTNGQLQAYLLRNIRYSERVVVVPFHVNVRQLWRQLAALSRWDGRNSRVARVPTPP
jgi:hypothetical protein